MPDEVKPDEARFVASLLARAEEDCRREREEARRTAASVVAAAREEARSEREKRLDRVRRKARLEADRALSDTRCRHEMERLRVLESAYARAVAGAREEAAALRGKPEYASLMERLLDECLAEYADPLPAKILVDERDRGVLEAVLLRRGWPTRIVETVEIPLGGLKVSDATGDRIVDNTIDTRFTACTSELRLRLANLFTKQESSCRSATTI